MKVCLGGTFSIIHAGHEALLRRAFQIGDEVIIGLTSDEMVRRRGKNVPPYEERKQHLQQFVQRVSTRKVEIVPLDDEYGPAAKGACNAIVVSPETAAIAAQINDIRRSNDLSPLRIITVPYVLADDGIPISSSRINDGEIENGHRIVPLHVSVGTSNEVKRATAQTAFQHSFDHLDIRCTATPVKTTACPGGKNVWEGALCQAEGSLGNDDYGVGIEAGIIEQQDVAMVEHVCTLVDKAGYLTWGRAPAFQIPPGLRENFTGKSIGNLVPDDEESLAAYLSNGNIRRKHLVREAITAALLPRLRGRH